MFTLKDGIECVRQEWHWCKDNPSKELSQEQMQGFMDGLQQAIWILNKLDKKEVIDIDESKIGTSTSHFLLLPKL